MRQQPDFEDIWKEYYPKLYVYLRSAFHILKYEDLEDMVQEIFLKAFGKRTQFNPRYGFSTWLYAIARNYCIDRLREKEIDITDIDPETVMMGADPVAARTLKDEERNAVRCALSRLPEAERTMVFLRYYENLSCRDIGSILKMPEGTVKSRFYSIRRKLEAELKETVGI